MITTATVHRLGSRPWGRKHEDYYAPGPGGRPVFWVKNLTISSPSSDSEVFAPLNMSFRAHTVTAIVDRKSERSALLLRALAGLMPLRSGSVTSRPRRPKNWLLRFGEYRTNPVGFVSAGSTVDAALTVRQNLLQPLKQVGLMPDATDVQFVLNTCGLGSIIDVPIAQCSPDVPLRVKVAQSLIGGSQTVLIEDPTAGKLAALVDGDMKFLSGLARSGFAVIISTTQARIASMCDRAILMSDGVVDADISHPNIRTIREHHSKDTNPIALLGPVPTASFTAPTSTPTPKSTTLDADQNTNIGKMDGLVANDGGNNESQPQIQASAGTAPNLDLVITPEIPIGHLPGLEDPVRDELQQEELALREHATTDEVSNEALQVVEEARRILDNLPGPVIEQN